MSSTQTLSEILTNNTKITNIGLNKLNKTNITNIGTNHRYSVVERLLEDYSEFIDPSYKNWFAKRFLDMPFELLHRFASESRQEAKDPRRLFAFKVKQWYDQQRTGKASKPLKKRDYSLPAQEHYTKTVLSNLKTPNLVKNGLDLALT